MVDENCYNVSGDGFNHNEYGEVPLDVQSDGSYGYGVDGPTLAWDDPCFLYEDYS